MRALVLTLVILVASGALAQETDFSKVQIKATKVAGSVYMLEGAGGNIAASIGEDGIVLIDDQFAPLAEKIQAALKALGVTNKPVRFVINTHYHGDHTGGNAPFARTSTVIAQENVRTRLAKGGRGGNGGSMGFDIEPAEKAALPIITFEHGLTVHLNGEEIRALHVPAGHTDGDAVIFFPRANVVHMGDDFVRYGLPFIDVDAGGSIDGMIAGLEQVIPQLPADVKVIPGHGELANLDDVRQFIVMLKATREVVSRALAAGKTIEQMREEKVLEPWKQLGGDFISVDAYLETLVNSLSGTKGGGFVKHN